MAYRGPFDGFHATEVAVSKTCLVRFDNNHYSVAARAVGRPVDVRAYADRIVIRQDGETVAEHPRSFGRGEIAYDPWHYVPILTRKPGALRNGAPFKGWQLPGALGRIRARLTGCDDGDRQFVRILAAVPYVAYFLNSPCAREHGKSVKTDGVNQSNINGTKLQEYPFPFCSPAEQAEIVRILDTRLEVAEMLRAEVDASLTRAEALRQSILKKAFAGELVPQDPTDEPASALLARIRAERAKAPARRRRTRVEA